MPRCKAVRPGHSVLTPKIRLTESGTDLNTILRCFLSFKTVVTSQNVIVFKIKKSGKKRTIRVGVRFQYLVPLADSEDEGDECNKEEEDEGEDKEPGDENGSALDTDTSLLVGNYLFAGLMLYSLILIFLYS